VYNLTENLHGFDSRLAAAGLITTPVLRTVVWHGLIVEGLLRHPNSETKKQVWINLNFFVENKIIELLR
jgi:hypothetical protein